MPSCQRSPYSDCWAINSAVQAASPRYRLAHSSTAGQAQGKAGHSDVRQGQDAGQGCVLLPPRSCVSPLRLAPPLHADSVAKVPPSRPQFDKYRLVLLLAHPFFRLFSKTALTVILCCISAYEKPQISSTKISISAQQFYLIDSHAVTQYSAVVFFHHGFVRHIIPATPPAAHLHVKNHLLQRRQRSLSSYPNGSPQPARL